MIKNRITIEDIPAIEWGEKSDKVIVAVHGNMSNKEDTPIEILAKVALDRGYQVLSFDLPEHGERKNRNELCKVQNCVADLRLIMNYTKLRWEHINLFANSMGVYFSLLAYENECIENAWFLSPVVDMERIIENMMKWFQITKEQLEQEQTIVTPVGQTLYWDYYQYVKAHPIEKWDVKTNILYGSKDDMCEFDTISLFTEKFKCNLDIIEGAEHYFHTPDQLEDYNKWLISLILF